MKEYQFGTLKLLTRLSKKLFLSLCLCGGFIAAAAAQYRFDSWTTDNGLPQNSVGSIVQTADGYLWFTTLDGLARFDGVRFTVFNKSSSKNLLSNRLTEMIAEGNTLWILTEEGNLLRYAEHGEFQTFTANDGLPSERILGLLKDSEGSVLAYSREGVARFDGSRFSIVRGGDGFDINAFRPYFAPSGTYWELTKDSLTAQTDGKNNRYELPPELQKMIAQEDFQGIVRMFETGVDELWISAGRRIFKLQDAVIREIIAEEMRQNDITVFAQDKLGNLWAGTLQGGACRFAQNRFVCFDSKNGLASNFIRNIFLDREGTLWLATNEKGIYHLSKQIVTPLSAEQGLTGKNAYSVLEDYNGAIWIGSFGSLAKYQNGEMTNYGPTDGLLYQSIQSLFEDRDGTLWIGSLEGVQFFKNGRFFNFMKQLGSKPFGFGIFDIHRDRQGVLWFATSTGLIKYENSTIDNLKVEDGLPGNNIKAILESRDGETLWVGTQSGLARIRNDTIESFIEKDGLAGNHIRALFEDESGTLWIGTYDSGLSRLRDGKFVNYKKANGLFSDGVFQILLDANGSFWMSSNQGIYRVNRAELEEFAEGKRRLITSTAYGKSDGMLSVEANGGGQPGGTKTSDGRLWFPTQDGVAVINPESVEINPLPPPVVIETIRIDDTEQSKLRDPNSAIEMQSGQENLEIDYTGLSFIKPEQVRFRYKMEGLEENWTEAGTRRTAFYPHLAPGDYTFHVIAANSDNVWNEQGATLMVKVIPPFYRALWFYAVCLIAFAVFIYLVYRRRVLHLERARLVQEEFSRRLISAHESERRRIAAELHDSIGQSLAMIKNRAVLSAESSTDENTRKQIDMITAQTTQTIGEVREISYALRPYLLDHLGLTKAVKSLLNKITETSELNVESELDDVDNSFDGEAEISIYRIIQESLSNILKHAEASEVQVFLKKSERNLTVLISDDGKGFDPNAVESASYGAGGFGLLGIAERVKMLGGTREIESEVGGGTNILIRIPLRESRK